MPTKLQRPNRSTPWRYFADLSPAEKAAVRRMYVEGYNVTAIGHHWRVYPGTVTTAAEKGGWRQPVEAAPVAKRIVAALAEHPAMTDLQLSKLLGCDPSYVCTIRHRLRAMKGRGRGSS